MRHQQNRVDVQHERTERLLAERDEYSAHRARQLPEHRQQRVTEWQRGREVQQSSDAEISQREVAPIQIGEPVFRDERPAEESWTVCPRIGQREAAEDG